MLELIKNLPVDRWLKFGELGLLAFVIFFGMIFISRMMRESNSRQDVLLQTLVDNTKALTGLQTVQTQLVTVIQSMQAVIMGGERRAVISEKEKPKPE